MSNNPQNLKYILQETRELKDNEFVFSASEIMPTTAAGDRMWSYICETFGVSIAKIDSEQLPMDSQNQRMHGFRLVRDEDLGEDV